MTTPIDNFLDFSRSICQEAQKILDEHNFKENLQIPHLHLAVVARLKILDADHMKDADSIIRMFVRHHGGYGITRGAKGGIMPIAKMQAKQALKDKKEQLKQELMQELEIKITEKTNEESK